MTPSAQDEAVAAFVKEFAAWRARRGMSMKHLARLMGFDPSYISHIEAGRHLPTQEFARRAEAVLQTGDRLARLFARFEELRQGPPETRARSGYSGLTSMGASVVIERECAALSYRDGWYHCAIRRLINNVGANPIVRYPVRVDVDRFPTDPSRSVRHYRDDPLTMEELDFTAAIRDHPDRRLKWQVKLDRDAYKKIIIRFEDDDLSFPLYPHERVEFEYSYRVPASKYGRWFQREVRLPTLRLEIDLDLPEAARPSVWGVEASYVSEAALRTPPTCDGRDGRMLYHWETEHPPLGAQYRLHWHFNVAEPPSAQDGPSGPQEGSLGWVA